LKPASGRTSQHASCSLGAFKSIHKTPLTFIFSSVFSKRENGDSFLIQKFKCKEQNRSAKVKMNCGKKSYTGVNFNAKRRFPVVFLAGGEPGMEK
jgi:hypothetical protein